MREQVESIVNKYSGERTDIVAILHDINSTMRFLPREALEVVAEMLSVPLSRLYATATFYRSFNLEPRGKHEIHVCLGTACHVRGGARILERLGEKLGIEAGKTTADGKFTLNRVNCVGACALGPLVVVDEQYHGRLDPLKAERILEDYHDQAE